MKTFAIAALAALTNAGKVHEFFAESNYICEMCKMAVEFANDGNTEKLEQLYTIHPALQTRINSKYGAPEIINFSRPQTTCEALELCDKPDIFDMLMAEMPLDLRNQIDHVNSNPKSK